MDASLLTPSRPTHLTVTGILYVTPFAVALIASASKMHTEICAPLEVVDNIFTIKSAFPALITATGSTTSSAGGLDKPLRGLLRFRLKAVWQTMFIMLLAAA